MTAEKFPYTFFCPPGLADQCNSGFSYGPESATQSRERQRIAVVVRELTAYFDAKFAQLEAKVDLATLGLITIANRELESIQIGVQQEQQADARLSPDQTCKSSVPKKAPVTKLVEDSLPQQDIRTHNRLAIVEDGAAQRQLSCVHFDISDEISTTTETEGVLSVEDLSTSNEVKLVGDWRPLPAMDWRALPAMDVKHDEIQQTHHEVSAQIVVEVPEILAAEIDKFIAIVSKNIETIPSGETRSDLVQHCDKLQQAVRKQIVGSPDSVRTLLNVHCCGLMDSRDVLIKKFQQALSDIQNA